MNVFVSLYTIAQCKQIKVICSAAEILSKMRKMKRKIEENERFFSVELKSRGNLKNVVLANGDQENVLVEGSIGELLRAEFCEGVILEVVGDKGVLRINLSLNDIKQKEKQEKEA